MTDNTFLNIVHRYARDRLSKKRYAHTLRVADTVERLAEIHGLDPQRLRLAALLHDSAREMDKNELSRIAQEEGIAIDEHEREQPILLHGPIAAKLARKDLGVEDEEVLEAVRAHTIGEPGMGPLALALYVADKIEPDRDQPGVEDLRKLALESLHRTAKTVLEGSVSHNEQRGRPTHPKSRQALEWLESSEHERADEVPEV